MKYIVLVIVSSLLSALTLVSSSYAHVLIRDTTGSRGAILHSIPDDDPIAGKMATVYLDAQDVFEDDAKIALSITREGSSEPMPVETKRDGSLVTAEYTFPSQGVYYLRYEITSDDTSYAFEQSIRVARGVGTGNQSKPRYAWAEMLLIFVATMFAVLCIVAFNRRKEITRQSTF